MSNKGNASTETGIFLARVSTASQTSGQGSSRQPCQLVSKEGSNDKSACIKQCQDDYRFLVKLNSFSKGESTRLFRKFTGTANLIAPNIQPPRANKHPLELYIPTDGGWGVIAALSFLIFSWCQLWCW